MTERLRSRPDPEQPQRTGVAEPRAYRRDIDGLRAIAVIAVIIHHLLPGWLPGGYVGVDIFFVISGYLITALIRHEINAGTFSVRRFYQRRINRLIPALLVVVSTSGIAALVLVAPTDLVVFAQSAFASLVGLSNVFFWQQYGNYFGTGADQAVLLHTWTLGVEEQFYLFWPLLLLLAARFWTRSLVLPALVLTVMSLAVSEYGVQNFTSVSYYLLPTRFFELAIGGTLAVWLLDRRRPGLALATVAGVAGLALLATSFVVLTPGSPFPGLNALLPCLGSALLILAGTESRSLTARLLGQPVPVFVGLVSYSLYLWHWPFVAYFHYVGLPIDLPRGVLIFSVVLVLAWLTWRFIEVPFRRDGARLPFRRVFIRRFALPASTFAVIAVLATAAGGFPARYPPEVAELEAMAESHPEVLRAGCHVPTARYAVAPSDSCRLGDAQAPIEGILLGDSVANHFTGMLDVMATAEKRALIDYTMDACPPIPGYSPPGLASYAAKCLARNEAAFAIVGQKGYRLVVLAASWPLDEAVGPLIARALDRLLATGAHVTIILRNPSIPNGATCPIRRVMYGWDLRCDAPESPQAPYWETIMRDDPEVTFLDPAGLICSGGECNPVLDGVLLYRDDDHLDDPGSRLLGRLFGEQGVRLFGDGS